METRWTDDRCKFLANPVDSLCDNMVDLLSAMVSDPYYFTAGPGIPHWSVTSTTATTLGAMYLMPSSEFSNDGIVLSFEFYATAVGSINFLVTQR